MPAKQLIPLIVLLILLTVPGCGSDEVTQETTLSKAQFGRQADLICGAAAEEQYQLAGISLNEHPGTKEVDLVDIAVIAPLEKEMRELSNLPVLEGQEEDALAFLNELKKALQAIKADPSAALATTNNPYDKANTLARHLGMGDCSRNP